MKFEVQILMVTRFGLAVTRIISKCSNRNIMGEMMWPGINIFVLKDKSPRNYRVQFDIALQ